MKLTVLGSSCMFPTKDRSQPAFLLFHEGLYFLFDAGEGVQRQLRIAGISPMSVDHVFISHWHGDHSLGVAGMIQNMVGNRRTKPFHIHGPRGTRERVKHIIETYDFKKGFDIKAHDLDVSKPVLKVEDLTVTAINVKHPKCVAFCVKEADKRRINLDYTKKFGLTKHPLLGKLQQGEDIVYKGKKITVAKGTYLKPGKKFVYITDTGYVSRLVEFAEVADLLVCESTYTSELEDRAEEFNHLTAEQAAMIARDAGVKQLVLTHFSQRYASVKKFVAEAKKHFKNVVAAEDFMEITF